MIEAAALRRLVNLKVEPEINHLLAITQDGKASHCFIPGTADWGRHRRITAHALRDLARREGGASGVVTLREAHALLRDGMEVVEGHSSEMFSEQSRKGFRETMVGQYQAMIEVCLELAAIEPSTEQREAFTWEAWHWCHRSKSRTLLDQLGSGRAQLDTPESQQFWNEMLQADAKLDRLDRLLLAMRANPSPDLLGVVADAVKAFKKGWDVNIDSCGQLGHLLFAREFAKENLAAARAAVQKSSGPLAAVEIPEGREIVRRLRARNAAHPAGMATIPSSRTSSPHDEQIQASGAAATDGAPGSRTLIAEYYVLGNDDIALFLVPLWLDQAPVVERLKLSLKALATAANSMMQSHGQLRGETRAARHVAKTRGRSEAERAKALEGSRQALRDIAPLAAAILNRAEREKWQPEELLLCPHYLLNLLPLHAAEVDGRPLIDHLPVAYLPSPAMALEWEEKPARAGTSPAGGEALIIGDPLGDLKGARQEANEVAKIARAAGLRAEPVIGRDALAAVTATGAPLARFIHAALHSLLDHEDFLRSGLEHADRRLPANEIMRLDLREALLVFLSSCDSGHAVVDRTDDLVALARAFFLAGTPSVIATLWALDDKAGVFFAPRFHHYWITGGLPMSRAFQKAMQETREEYTEPFYWAPFVLMGRWDTVWSLPAAA